MGATLVLLALILASTGCGSSGGPESTGSLSKAEFLKKGNAICAKGSEEINKAYEEFSRKHVAGGKTPSEALLDEAAAEIVLPVREREVRLLRALGTPSGQEQRVDAMLTAWEEGIEKGEKDPNSLRKAGPEFAFYKSYSMGIAYGLKKCWLS
ncbi:MAG: hypothetical protein ACTHNP_05610 [Solirubrobacterales bacterium]